MIHYVVYGSDGVIDQRGFCPCEDDLPIIDGKTVEVVTEDDPRQPTPPPAPTYVDYRQMGYPSIGDQLDAIWKVLESTNLINSNPDVKAIYDRVKQVKTTYPKGTN